MCKKIVSPLFAFFTLLFLLPLTTYAYETTVTIDSTWVSKMNSNLDNMKNSANSYISQNPQYNHYILYFRPSTNVYMIQFFSSDFDITSSNFGINGSSSNGIYIVMPANTTSYVLQCQWNYSTYVINSCGSWAMIKSIYYTFPLLYANFDIPIINNSNIYNIVYDNVTTSYSYATSSYFPTLDIIVNGYTPPPGPSDPYPLITDYFDVVSSKILFITEYFTSNYIYLYVFSIFIFYFVILLFRRLL